jgi:hypothetical protein
MGRAAITAGEELHLAPKDDPVAIYNYLLL